MRMVGTFIHLRHRPYLYCLVCKCLGPPLDLYLVPMLNFHETPVETDRTSGKATFHIVLLAEWVVTQFGIISCERQVTDSVQIPCMYLFPIGAEFLLPFRG